MGLVASALGSSFVDSVGLTSATVWTWVAALADGAAGVVSVDLELVCGDWSPMVRICSPLPFSPKVVTETLRTGVLNLIKG